MVSVQNFLIHLTVLLNRVRVEILTMLSVLLMRDEVERLLEIRRPFYSDKLFSANAAFFVKTVLQIWPYGNMSKTLKVLRV